MNDEINMSVIKHSNLKWILTGCGKFFVHVEKINTTFLSEDVPTFIVGLITVSRSDKYEGCILMKKVQRFSKSL